MASPASEIASLFDGLADLYDEVRPGYPAALVDDVLALSGIPASGAILEVGCGTGQATRLFAARGHRMTCIEPGSNLAARTLANCRAWPEVSVVNARFEDWPAPEATFDLVIAAQSFHWIDPAVAYAKAGRCLRATGALALFWNWPVHWDRKLRDVLDRAYQRHGLGERAMARKPRMIQVEGCIEATGLFGPVRIERYPWTDRRSAEEYVKLLRTHSDHASLPADVLRSLCAEIRAAVEEAGGEIAVDHVAVLYFALRRR